MAELQSDMSNLRERLNEADGEAKAHAISYKMLKEDLTARLVSYNIEHTSSNVIIMYNFDLQR